jgi:hypothetical protein
MPERLKMKNQLQHTAGQAKARIESGAAKSIREAAKQIACEIGRNPKSIRRRIMDGKKNERCKVAPCDKQKPHVSNNSGNNNWYTPKNIIKIARKTI